MIAIYQVFETADEPMTLGLGNDAIWKRFWEAVGQPEVGARPGICQQCPAPRQARGNRRRSSAGCCARKPRAHWLDLFANARVPAGPIQRLDELAQDAALHESGFIYQH